MYPAQVLPSAGVAGWCPRRDSNPHASRPPALDRRRLPVPSRGLSCWWGASRPPRSGGRGSSRLSARRTADQPSPPVRRCAAGPGRDVASAVALRCVALAFASPCLTAVPLRGSLGLRRGNRTLACPVSGETGRQTVAGDGESRRGSRAVVRSASPPTRESNPHRGLRRPPSRSTQWEIERRHDTWSWPTLDQVAPPRRIERLRARFVVSPSAPPPGECPRALVGAERVCVAWSEGIEPSFTVRETAVLCR